MSVSMIGIDFNKASVDIRSKFSFTKKNAVISMERLKEVKGILGCVILLYVLYNNYIYNVYKDGIL